MSGYIFRKKIIVTRTPAAASKTTVAVEPEDKVLVSATLAGDRLGFEKLVRKYERYVMTLTLRYVRDPVQAEELAQDVFVKAYRSLPQFEGKSRFSTWLYTIVNSVCLSFLRKKQSPTDTGNDFALENHEDLSGDTEMTADRRRWQGSIDAAVARLHADEQRVITLYYQAGQSVQEIAAITGRTAANIKVKLFRARQKLRTLLARTYMEMKS